VGKEIEKLVEMVTRLLIGDPRLRDSDKKLSARVWLEQLRGIDKLKKMTAYDFLVLYTDDSAPLYSQESIGRARRLIQEHNPELRGQKYKERKEEEQVVKLVVQSVDNDVDTKNHNSVNN
jgi:hypothetical protein